MVSENRYNTVVCSDNGDQLIADYNDGKEVTTLRKVKVAVIREPTND